MIATSAFQVLSETAMQTPGPVARVDFAFWVVVCIAVLTIGSFLLVYYNLVFHNKDWTLKDALSEEVMVSAIKDSQPVLDKDDKPQMIAQMKASSSRLIALIGMIAILMLYLGVGVSILYGFAIDGKVPPDAERITSFFLYGSVLFAPYIVNKFSDIFAWLKPGR